MDNTKSGEEEEEEEEESIISNDDIKPICLLPVKSQYVSPQMSATDDMVKILKAILVKKTMMHHNIIKRNEEYFLNRQHH